MLSIDSKDDCLDVFEFLQRLSEVQNMDFLTEIRVSNCIMKQVNEIVFKEESLKKEVF